MTTRSAANTPPAEQAIADAARVLRTGGVVCFPTETTYGLAVDPRLPAALERLVALKGRPRELAVALIACDADQARCVARVWPEEAQALAAAHWPGPLTLVVPARGDLEPAVVGATGGVGVRVSSHPWARALAAALGHPVTATSANRSGAPAALTCAEAQREFGAEVDCYLDDGDVHTAGASTVVAIDETGEVTELRAGPVRLDAIRAF